MTNSRTMPKKIMAMLIAVLMLLSVLPTFASAADGVSYVIDKTVIGSLTIHKQNADSKVAIQGAGYTLYKVAEINQTLDANGTSVTTFDMAYSKTIYVAGDSYTIQNGDYAGTTVTLPAVTNVNSSNTVLFSNDVVAALLELGVIEKVAGETLSDVNGEVYFPNLDSGYVYLALETKLPAGVSIANNFLVTVPSYAAETSEGGVTTPAHWDYDVDVYPKNDITTTKEAYLNGEPIGSVEYGKVYTYKVTSNIPSDINPYLDSNNNLQYYKSLTITDKAGANIEYVLDGTTNLPAVTVTLKNASGTNVVLTAGTDYVFTYDSTTNSFKIELIDTSITWANLVDGDITTLYNKFVEGDYLEITYDAKIVNNTSSSGGNTNTVTVASDPIKDFNTTTEKTVDTYDYRVWKVKANTDDTSADKYLGLEGAEFALLDANKKYMAVYEYEVDDGTGTGTTIKKYEWITYDTEADWQAGTEADAKAYQEGYTSGTLIKAFTSDKYGLFTIEGLTAGTYYLVETKAPDGYVISTDLIEIKVGAESDSKAQKDYKTDAGSDSEVDVNTLLNGNTDDGTGNSTNFNGTDYYSVQIINKTTGENGNWTLPTTGDMGIGLYIIVGALIMAAAIGLYVYNRKKNRSSKA